LDRRSFIATSSLAIAAPFVLSSSAFANGSLRVRRDVQAMPETDRFFCDYAEAVRAMHELPEGHPCSWR
jgi:tyrosinase